MDGDYDSALDAGVYGNGIGSAADNVTGAWLQRACEEWIAAKHVLFHVANVCFSVAFVSPNIFRYHVLFMRALVCSGFFLLLLWTSIYACHADMLTWNCLFLLISLVHLGSLLWELHPAKFSRDLDEIYRRHFKPLRVSSGLFKELAKIGEMRTLSVQDDYAKEDVTVAGERLSVLISGR
ncbi:PREDICTED: blood vessel epicardial substance-like [Priapulus caudatus]|uniref:Blood vessel epicardial substance-like n=1 Tax=Priapulus caudatus TaxID=37621 RepID=A0ABM1EKB4_PRICU|nr:PREDICTED: blood vessel epicardial substance-like [Priapulus caudatus]